jgi:hypothetical protein
MRAARALFGEALPAWLRELALLMLTSVAGIDVAAWIAASSTAANAFGSSAPGSTCRREPIGLDARLPI